MEALMNTIVDRKKLFFRIAFLIFFVFLINALAIKFYWYYSIRWFDMPMHFLGGFWVGLALLWFFNVKYIDKNYIYKVILGVLFVGLCWEVFEFFVNNLYFARYPFDIVDTIQDIFFDLFGGFLSLIYFKNRIMRIEKN